MGEKLQVKPWIPAQSQQRSKGNFCKWRNDIQDCKRSGFLVEVIETLAVKCPYTVELQVAIKKHVGFFNVLLAVQPCMFLAW